jgi:hypothetical protein
LSLISVLVLTIKPDTTFNFPSFTFHSRYIQSYISFPISIGYKILAKKKFDISISTGINFNFFVKDFQRKESYGRRGELMISEGSASAGTFSKFLLSAMAKVEFGYNISDKIRVNLSPNVDFAFDNALTTELGFYPYNIGLQAGIGYNF